MKTVIAGRKVKDNYFEIAGFSEPTIDPVATRKIVDPLLKKTKEAEKLEKLSLEYGKRLGELNPFRQKLLMANMKNNKTKMNEALTQIETLKIIIHNIMEETKKLKPELNSQKTRLIQEHAVYFHPRKGEFIVCDEEAEFLSKKKTNPEKGCVFTIELSEKCDKIKSTEMIKLPAKTGANKINERK